MPKISIANLVAHRESLLDAWEDCRYKNSCSKTSGPIEVMPIQDEHGKYQLIDGYHRLIPYLILSKHIENNGKIEVKINKNDSAQGYYSIARKNERWVPDPSLKYGNLEDFIALEILDDDVEFFSKLDKEKEFAEALNIFYTFKNLTEAIASDERKTIENATPNTILTVYHGTPAHRLPQLLNGFDATVDFSRDYRAGQHRGLFVTADFELAKSFGGGAIIEIKVPAKFIHGTDWSGHTGREQEKEKGKDILNWVKDLFPNSFRPYMSYTMLASSEPQGLFVGLVKPSQITGLWVYEHAKGSWVKKDRKEFLASGATYNAKRVLDKTIEDKVFDADIDLSSPRLDLYDFISALAKFENNAGKEDRYIESLKRYAKLSPERFEEILRNFQIGGSYLGNKALQNIKKQILALI